MRAIAVAVIALILCLFVLAATAAQVDGAPCRATLAAPCPPTPTPTKRPVIPKARTGPRLPGTVAPAPLGRFVPSGPAPLPGGR